MGQAKARQAGAFDPALVALWEAEDCASFAVALARHSGWLLNVAWLALCPPDRLKPERGAPRVPLRLFVTTGRDLVLDPRAITEDGDFHKRVLVRVATQRHRLLPPGRTVVDSSCYAEGELSDLPLSAQPSEAAIERARAAIMANASFLDMVPRRPELWMPAIQAFRYASGDCVVYAEALAEMLGTEATGVRALRMRPGVASPSQVDSGWFHSFVQHPDGSIEDSWGRHDLPGLMARYGVAEWRVDASAHRRVVEGMRTHGPAFYQQGLDEARRVLAEFHPGAGARPGRAP